MRPKKLTIINGKPAMVDYDSRRAEYQQANKERWIYDAELLRFYNSKAWKNSSKMCLLNHDYICCVCGGEATLTDHRVPVKVAWELRLDPDNHQPMCDSCHNIKTQEDKKKYNL